MITERLTLTGDPEDAALVARAAAIIRRGGLVAFPTETVYGLGAYALDADAVGRIFAAKGRPAADPVIVHVADASALSALASVVPATAHTLAQAFWPGPLTLIVQKAEAVPARVTAGGPTVAVRVPAHPVAQALLRAAGVPIAAPSANRFSRPSPTRADDVLEDLGSAIDAILDGGPTTHGVESTVLDLTSTPPRVLRPGAIPLDALLAVDPTIQMRETVVRGAEAPLTAPGTLLKHYSPRAEVRLWTGPADLLRHALIEDAKAQVATGRRVGVLATDEDLALLGAMPVITASLGAAARVEEAAQRLFAGLRDLDRAGVDVVIVRDPGRSGLALTVWDRLFRAAEGRVLESR